MMLLTLDSNYLMTPALKKKRDGVAPILLLTSYRSCAILL